MRLVEIRDASRLSSSLQGESKLMREMGAGAALFAGLDIHGTLGGVLGVLSSRPVESWHVDVYLLLKLIGASLSAALTRLKLGRELGDIYERDELTRHASNDGVWDFDVETNMIRFSPRWKIMMGYGENEPDEDMPDWRQLVHPDDMVRVQGKIRDHLEARRNCSRASTGCGTSPATGAGS
jgi:PAS domain-containing protein